MTIKQINTNKNIILKVILILVFIITVSTPVKAAPTQLHPEGNTAKQTTFQIQANCDSGQALTYTNEQGLICKDEVKGSSDTEQSEISESAEEFINIINTGDEAAKLAFAVDFCGASKYLVGFTIGGEIRCLDKSFPQLTNSQCDEGEVSYGFEKTTEKEVYQLNILKTGTLPESSSPRLIVTDLQTGAEIINVSGLYQYISTLVDVNDNALPAANFDAVVNPAINTADPSILISDSPSLQTTQDIAAALPLYWKYAGITDYTFKQDGTTLNISTKDGSSISNFAITTLEDEFENTTVTFTTEDVEESNQLDRYRTKCINLEDYIVSTPSSQKDTQLLQNISSAISCEEGEIITRLSIENTSIFVGAPGDDDGHDNSGAVYIFKRDVNENWSQEYKISENNGTGENISIDLDANDAFGESVSHYNKTIAIGAPGDDDGSTTSTTDYSGAVYLFEQKEDGGLEKMLKISDNSGGDGFLNVDLSVGDYFGSSVSLFEDLLFVGAPKNNDGGQNSGAVYIFEKDANGEWSFSHKIVDDSTQTTATQINLDTGDSFGESVFYYRDLLFIGASLDDDGGTDRGAAYVFEKGETSEDWSFELKISDNSGGSKELNISDLINEDYFGSSISYKDGELAVGAPGGGKEINKGSVFTFNRADDGTWTKDKKITYATSSLDEFTLVNVGGSSSFTSGVFKPGSAVANSNSVIIIASSIAPNGPQKGGVIVLSKQSDGSLNQEFVFTDSSSTDSSLNVDLDADDEFGKSVAIDEYKDAGGWVCEEISETVGLSFKDENRACETLLKQAAKQSNSRTFSGNLNGTNTNTHQILLPYSTNLNYKGYVYTQNSEDDILNNASVNIRKAGTSASNPILENQTIDPGFYIIEVSGRNTDYNHNYKIEVTPTFDIPQEVSFENCKGFVVEQQNNQIVGNDFYVSVLSSNVFNVTDDKKITIFSSKDATFEVKSPCGSSTGTNLVGQEDQDINLIKTNGDPLDIYTNYNCDIEVTGDDGDVLVKTIPEFVIYDILDLNNYDEFATDTAISDSYVAFGAPGDNSTISSNKDDTGAVYLFRKPNNNKGWWENRIEFSDNNGGYGKVAVSLEKNDGFGGAVSLDDDTLVVGADFDDDGGGNRGAVYIFEKGSSGEWSQTLKISDNDGNDGELEINLDNSDRFGYSVAYSNLGVLVVGAFGDDDGGNNRGSVYIFEKDSNGEWSQTLKISDNGESDGSKFTDVDLGNSDFFGSSVAIYADTSERVIAVGAPKSTSTDTGTVYIFERQTDGTWDHANTISESATDAGDTQIDLDNYDLFGTSVGLYKDTLAVGAPKDDDGGTDKGAAYVFERNSSGNWIKTLKISENTEQSGEIDVSFLGLEDESAFGNSIEVYNDLLIVGEQDKGGETLFEGAAHIFEINEGEFNYSETISNGYPNN